VTAGVAERARFDKPFPHIARGLAKPAVRWHTPPR